MSGFLWQTHYIQIVRVFKDELVRDLITRKVTNGQDPADKSHKKRRLQK